MRRQKSLSEARHEQDLQTLLKKRVKYSLARARSHYVSNAHSPVVFDIEYVIFSKNVFPTRPIF